MNDLYIKREYRSAQEIEELPNWGSEPAEGGLAAMPQEADFIGKHLTSKAINYLVAAILCIIALILARSFYLQIIKGDYYQQLAETNRTRQKPIIASRGLIYDSQHLPLVKNLPFFDALILPKDLSFDDQIRQNQLQKIANTLGLSFPDIQAKLDKYQKNFKYEVSVLENIDYNQALLLKIKAGSIPGLYIETSNQRQYLYPNEFSHLIGYESKITEDDLSQKQNQNYLFNDYIGRTGLEASYEPVLRGQYGQDTVEVDVTGQEKKVLFHQDVVNGKNLVLTIDQKVQTKAEEILAAGLKRFGDTRGSLIMIKPDTGEVLALVSYPDFDDNLFAGGISADDYKKLTDNPDQPLFDRAIKGEYPSGSCIKPAIAAGALQEKVITDKTTVLSTGGLMIDSRWWFPDWSAKGHGITDVYKAIAWSVNTFFYIIGGGYKDFAGLGPDRLEKYFKLFGLGVKTGIDLPNEAAGLVPDPLWKLKTKNEQWYIGDTYHESIGQGDLLVTPIQIANYVAAIANGGKLMVPHLVKEIDGNDGSVQSIQPQVIRSGFIDAGNIKIVQNAMRQTVTSGSAQYMNALDFAAAGKTGTAQWRSDKKNQAWYVGFAPFQNPEVAIMVLVEEGGEGSTVSVPIAHDMLEWYFDVYKKGQKG